jgi:hypothetical protein
MNAGNVLPFRFRDNSRRDLTVNLQVPVPSPAQPQADEYFFPVNRQILIPQRSSLITRELMEEQISLLSRKEIEWKHARVAGSKIQLMWGPPYGDALPPDFLLITDQKNILRAYVRQDADFDCKIRQGTFFGVQCEKAAASNISKFMYETIAEPDLPEAIAEVEHQLSFVPRNQEVKRYRNRLPEKKIFLRYERWKQSRKS